MGLASFARRPATPAINWLLRDRRKWLAHPMTGTLTSAVLVSIAYYLGARLGLELRLPGATPSVMWPPNAILTAALLLSPTRRWWIYLLAAFPAHVVVELGTSWPAPMIVALFLTNSFEALIAAGTVRRISGERVDLSTLRGVAVFIVGAGLAAPFISSFADAAVVAGLNGEEYGSVWRTRFFSNVLTELTFVPSLLLIVEILPEWLREAPRRRQLEALLLGLGLMLACFGVFGGLLNAGGAIPISANTPLAFLLPFLLWAAVRFGPGGASLALLITAVLATWTGTRVDDPFAELSPAEGVLAFQVFLSSLAIPLLCLAAVVKERRLANERLAERLRFEELLSRFSSAFVHLPLHEVDGAIQGWLGRLGEFLDLDRSALLLSSDDGQDLSVLHTWSRPGLEGRAMIFARRDYPWAVRELGHMRPFVAARLDDLPPEASRDVETLTRDHIRSILTLPLVSNGRVFGGLALVTTAQEREWPSELIQQLRLMAEVFAGVLSRRQMVGALQSSEAMKSAILGSLSSNLAVLDREGLIIAVNQGWTKFMLDHDPAFDEPVNVGINYVEFCRHAAARGEMPAAAVLDGVLSILGGARPRFSLEYACDPPCGRHWFAVSVVPLRRSEGGAVVAHTEITARKRAEAEAQRRREELAHFTRVSSLGELVASLTHELKQPLTAILNNAQAGRRLLDVEPADMSEVREVLADIVDDDRRAVDLIQRLRDLLRRGEVERAPLDVSVLVRDVVKLVTSDALLRNISLGLDLAPEPLTVKGDPIELRQVVLNLLLNAMDAVAECVRENRTVIVQTRAGNDRTARVSVQDTGPGLRDDTRDLIFEPFYTTKPGGMGMGLSIARSILEAHGGSIVARNNRTRGATFNVTLPLVNERAG